MKLHLLLPKRALGFLGIMASLATVAEAREPNTSLAAPGKPLCFIQNVGQVKDQNQNNRNDIDYRVSAPGISLFVGDGAMHYMWYKELAAPPAAQPKGVHIKDNNTMAANVGKTETYRLDVTLVGANKNAVATAGEEQEYTERYYLTGVPDGALAHSYSKVTYKNIYPNIDWVVYSNDNNIKYDFVVHPGGNPANIKLQYDGATTFNTESGAVTVTTPMGSITEQKPYSYDAATGQEIASSFVMNGNTLSFATAAHNGTMVIDPSILWGTYYGANNSDAANGMAVDGAGNIWMALGTTSTNNLVSVGAHQNFLNGTLDGMLVRCDGSGTINAATYYGGTNADRFNAIAIDGNGNIYCAGNTSSTNGIATAGTAQTTLGGTTSVNEFADGFVVKFNSTSQRLWGTYYGGSETDVIIGLTADGIGNVYICGSTKSSNAMATPGTFQTGLYAGSDGFVGKLSQANGTRVWGTYYGGEDVDELQKIATDGTSIYLCGWTGSANNIATAGAHQTTNPGANIAPTAWFAKMNASGLLNFGTYYGDADEDVFQSLTISGNSIYLSGYTNSSSNIASAGAYQAAYSGGNYDGILAKFNTAGVRQWGTYFGAADADIIRSIYANDKGYIHFAGYTQSTGLATTGAYKTNGGGNGYYDGLWGQFSPDGKLIYCSYYGGNDLTQIMATAQGINGEILLGGYSRSTVGIATPGGWQTVHGGAEDALLVSFKADTLAFITNPLSANAYCGGDVFTMSYTVNNIFKAGNTFTAQLSDALGNFAAPVAIGTATATNDGTISCTIPTAITAGTQYRIRIVASNPVCTSAVNTTPLTLNPVVAPSVQITATPGTTVGPYKQVSMNVNATGGGLSPFFQWKKNGQAIPGATASFITLTSGVDFINGDQITVDMTSNAPCANPSTVTSNSLSLSIELGVNDVANGEGVQVYPNPTTGTFNISNLENIHAEKVVLTDMMGKTVYAEKVNGNAVRISLPAGIANGIYILKLQTPMGELQSKLTLQR